VRLLRSNDRSATGRRVQAPADAERATASSSRQDPMND
jgi:hypothetical protein